jgi:hypothetical protein
MIKNIISYDRVSDVFELLNQNKVNYAILRNYDNLLDDNIYMDGHGDIDLICEDSAVFAEVIKAYPQEFHVKNGKPDGSHYYTYVKNNYVSLDLRHIGDGYYCKKWEKEMLERKVLHNGFYVLNEEDYFYTLIYHAIYQKPLLSAAYRNRITEMAKNLNLDYADSASSDFISLLEIYMKNNNYRYQYPKDKYVPFKKKNIQDNSLLDFHFKEYFKNMVLHFKIAVIEFLVKTKHFLLNLKD